MLCYVYVLYYIVRSVSGDLRSVELRYCGVWNKSICVNNSRLYKGRISNVVWSNVPMWGSGRCKIG